MIDKERVFCTAPECGAYDGHHNPMCSLASDEYLAGRFRRYVTTYESRIQRVEGALKRQRELTAQWHGRYEILRRENNALRRKVRGLKRDAE
jgi:hypothetical protein